jgi:hypothetical protein
MQRFVLDFRTIPHRRVVPRVLECVADIGPPRASLTTFPLSAANQGCCSRLRA